MDFFMELNMKTLFVFSRAMGCAMHLPFLENTVYTSALCVDLRNTNSIVCVSQRKQSRKSYSEMKTRILDNERVVRNDTEALHPL